MLGPQLDGLEPLNVFSVEEQEANSGHSFVHLKKGVAPKASWTTIGIINNISSGSIYFS